MGDVHLAKLSGELGFEKLVVVKTIRAELASDPRFVELFASEAKTAVSLSHPNITPIYELGRADDGTLYTAMGWVDGPSLAQWIERRRNQGSGGFELGASLAIVRELLDALAHAHSREQGRTPVVHRDVTPRNVLVERSGRVQLVDFGIAKPAGTGGGVQGSAGYMAPEQARGEPVDPRADLFSVGTLLYELLALEQAFPHEGIWALPDMRPIHPRLRPLLERALALDPAARFADARAFLREVAALQAELAPGYASLDLSAALREQFSSRGWTNPEIVRPVGATPSTRVTPVHRTVAFATRSTQVDDEPEPTTPSEVLAAAAVPEPTATSTTNERATIRVRRRMLLLLGLAAAGVLGLGLGLRWFADAEREPQPRATTTTTAKVAAPVSEPGLEAVRIPEPEPAKLPSPTPAIDPFVVSVTPTSAELWRDGTRMQLDGPPFELPADTTGALELRAPGHRTRTLALDPAGERTTSIELDPLGEGTLTVLAPGVAWAEVWIDGERLGSTPLRERPLAEGRHKLEVRCTVEVCGEAQVLLRKSLLVRADKLAKISVP